MQKLLRYAALAAALGAVAPQAGAATIVVLSLDPSASSLTPAAGPAQSLSGTLTLSVGSLPTGGANTTFDVVGLAVSASGGASFALDPGVANPGLGVLSPAGAFLVPDALAAHHGRRDLRRRDPGRARDVVFGPGGAVAQPSSRWPSTSRPKAASCTSRSSRCPSRERSRSPRSASRRSPRAAPRGRNVR